MRVFVIMGNDFPEAVRHSEIEAKDFVTEMKTLDKEPGQRRIHWRYYEFEMPIVHPPMSEPDEWATMEANCK